jgi:hypothetical protein
MTRFLCLGILISTTFTMLAQQSDDFDIYDINTIREVKITFKEQNWDYILDSLKQRGYDQRLIGDVEYGGKVYKGAGVRFKGNSSYFSVRKSGYSKLPFNIDMNETNKDDKMPGGYDKLKLSNIFRDPSFMREVLSYEIAGNYMPASRCNFVKLFVNGEYMGLYNNTESVDDEFLDRYYDEHKGVLFKCDPIWGYESPSSCREGEKASLQYLGDDPVCYKGKYEIKSDDGWNELVKLTRMLDKNPEKLDSIFNVDQALWMLAFNITLVNLDSYTGRFCHNYYLYQDETGVFHPIIWDMNLSFGGFRYLGVEERLKPLTNEEMKTLSPFSHYKQKNEKRPLITNLLAIPLYRKVYLAHIRTILNDHFIDSSYLERARELQSLVDEHVMRDTNKLYEYPAFKDNLEKSAKADKVSIIGIAELMQDRTKYLNNHSLLSKPAPEIKKVEHLDFGDLFTFTAELEGAERAWLFYRYGNKGAFRKLEMFDDSGHADGMEGDGVWGASLDDKGEIIQYYVVAEGEHIASLMPERAAFEFLTTADEEGNVIRQHEQWR